MNRINLSVLALITSFTLTACGNRVSQAPVEFQTDKQSDRAVSASLKNVVGSDDDSSPELEAELDRAEAKASADGLVILKVARSMILNGVIIKGSCWDYIDGVYKKSNVVGRDRVTTFKSAKPGPFAPVTDVQAGDWLYFINHSYGDVEHSGIFIDWIDFETKEALVMSYPGGNQMRPARYSSYILSNIYNVIRPKAGVAKPL